MNCDGAGSLSESWDYIVVGGGSAGCVLASRLSANPLTRVLLLEAGGDNKSLFVSMPKGFGVTLRRPGNAWYYTSEPHDGGPNTPAVWVGGKGLGGGSAVNGLLYVRCQPEDYEEWARIAGPEWGWEKMRQAFRSIENHELGDDGNRGVGGPVGISVNTMRSELEERFVEAGVSMGLPRRDDLNGVDQEGVGYHAQNVWKGRRVTSAMAFLDPVRRRQNLTVLTHVQADRIGFDGARAARIHAHVKGEDRSFECRGEIVVSCGAIGTPILLQRSGIGPAELLDRHAIPIVSDLPVGRHFREQFAVVFVHRLKRHKGYNHRYRGLGLIRSLLEYVFLKRGVLANCVWDVGLFARSRPDEPRPDIQMQVGGAAMDPAATTGTSIIAMAPYPALTAYGYLNQLDSEGKVEIRSADPDVPPSISHNFFACEKDRRRAVDMVRFVRNYFRQPVLEGIVGEELAPLGGESEDEILSTVLRMGIAGLHGTGTCAMGKDESSAIDERLRVRGVTGLRVADCSAMPALVSGNTNAPAMALGWRASDLIIEDFAAGKVGAKDSPALQ
jgi:choline dehydrogenase